MRMAEAARDGGRPAAAVVRVGRIIIIRTLP
jgi:hypothetical protein